MYHFLSAFSLFFFKRSAPASNAITNKYLYHAACAGEKERCTLAQRQAFGNAAIPLLIMHLSFLLVLNHIFSPAALPKPRPLPPGLDLARGRVCKFNPFCTHHQTAAREDGVAFLFSLAISRLLLHVLFLFHSFILTIILSFFFPSKKKMLTWAFLTRHGLLTDNQGEAPMGTVRAPGTRGNQGRAAAVGQHRPS